MKPGHAHALYDAYQAKLGDWHSRPTSRDDEAAPELPGCEGTGEIQGNTSRRYPMDPQNDVSSPCPGCSDCDPEDDEAEAPTSGTKREGDR